MKYFFIMLTFAFLLSASGPEAYSQNSERKKPKIKKIGASLERKSQENSALTNEKKEGSSDEEVVRVDTNLVVLDCLVVDAKGNIVEGLRSEDFLVSEDGGPQKIQNFALGSDARVPRSIVLVIDYSGSQKPYIERSVEAAKILVDKLRPNDLMAIVTDDVELIAQFTSDKTKLKKELNSLKRNGIIFPNIGKSQQFSALYAALNEMFDETDVRPIVIFQTDGDELLFLSDQHGDKIVRQNPAGSLMRPKAGFSSIELLQLANKSRASLYSIFVGAKLLGLSQEERQKKLEIERLRLLKYWGIDPARIAPPTPRQIELEEEARERIKKYYPNGLPDVQEFMSLLSQQTNGWLEFLEEPEQADGIYTRILSELNTRYIIGYNPTNEDKDGKRRTIKVEVKDHPEYKVLGKTSYVASPR